MESPPLQQTFIQALDALVDQVKEDRSILAAILCGSLSYDTVWARSDIDLVLVTIDDRTLELTDRALYADGVNVHTLLFPRAKFRTMVESAAHNSFGHSFIAKGRLLYSHDDTIADLCTRMSVIGTRDTQVQLLRAGTAALAPIYKAHKWLVTRGDLDLTALWILYAATPLAQVEVFARRLLADREVIPQALALNPEFFAIIYAELLNGKKTRKSVQRALDAVDAYVAERADSLFAPVLDYLREVGDVRSCTEIEDHFARNFNVHGITTACEYLADLGRIGKASASVQLTKRSNVHVQELAFYARGDGRDGP